MRLFHYAAEPVYHVESVPTERRGARHGFTFDGAVGDKPVGLWISDDDDEWSWPAWCLAENFNLQKLRWRHAVTFASDARILYLCDADAIDKLTRDHGAGSWLDWRAICRDWQGIIITPYCWERRLADTLWYYSWDCAGGCIWDAAAIAWFGEPERTTHVVA